MGRGTGAGRREFRYQISDLRFEMRIKDDGEPVGLAVDLVYGHGRS
jgi:hypothetical protein